MNVTYDFYTNNFKGSIVPAESFDANAMRADEYLMSRINVAEVPVIHELAYSKCICRLAELFYKHEVDGGDLTSETVGPHSKSFKSDNMAFEARLNYFTNIYLLKTGMLYRGISS